MAQTATVRYDPSRTSVAELAGWVRDCGYHCAGQSVPQHVCDPLAEPSAADGQPSTHANHGATHAAAAAPRGGARRLRLTATTRPRRQSIMPATPTMGR